MDQHMLRYIVALVARNPGQMSLDEYGEVVDEIGRKQNCKTLIFGMGNDSPLWVRANSGGTTIFVEHASRWAARAQSAILAENLSNPFEISMVLYKTNLNNWELEIKDDLSLSGLEKLTNEFDVILVDAPPGQGRGAPGRLQSLYEASRLCAPKGAIFVHDMKRLVEKEATKELLVKRAGFKGKKVTDTLSVFRRR